MRRVARDSNIEFKIASILHVLCAAFFFVRSLFVCVVNSQKTTMPKWWSKVCKCANSIAAMHFHKAKPKAVACCVLNSLYPVSISFIPFINTQRRHRHQQQQLKKKNKNNGISFSLKSPVCSYVLNLLLFFFILLFIGKLFFCSFSVYLVAAYTKMCSRKAT